MSRIRTGTRTNAGSKLKGYVIRDFGKGIAKSQFIGNSKGIGNDKGMVIVKILANSESIGK